jgi:methyltransferase (TIGR00027 family)
MFPLGASLTAQLVCWMRATDQLRPPAQRVIDDPYAELFVNPALRASLNAARAAGWPPRDPVGMTTYVMARHRFIDDCMVEAAAAATEPLQVVLLGAGYDTRAYRFANRSDLRFFEVDHPATFERKRRLVEANADRLPATPTLRAIELDFTTSSVVDKLAAGGLDSAAPMFFVWEGVTMYLPCEVVRRTLADIRRLCRPGSQLAVELWRHPRKESSWSSVANRAGIVGLRLLAEPTHFALPRADAGSFLADSGFELTTLADASYLQARYVRDNRRLWPNNYMVLCRRR